MGEEAIHCHVVTGESQSVSRVPFMEESYFASQY